MPTGVYPRRKLSPRELFEARVQRGPHCWIWGGTIGERGYGLVQIGGRSENGGRKMYAHRLSYELHVGRVPDGLELDHLCRNKSCVRPDHLEAVTRSVNTLRGIGPSILARINGSKTHCKHGHPFDEMNTYYRKQGGRACRTCLRRAQRESVARQKTRD